MLTKNYEALYVCMCCVHTHTHNHIDAHFHHPNVNIIWLNNRVILRFGLALCTKHEYVFTNKSTALKPAGALFRDGETPKWYVQVNKQVKRGCPGLVMQALVGLLPNCHASCVWLGWDVVQEHSLKGSTDDLFPSLFFPLALLLLSAVKNSLQKEHMNNKA